MWSQVKSRILPTLLAIGIVCVVEVVTQLRYRPNLWQKTTWLMHDPYRVELFDRVEMYIRLSNLEDSDHEIISVGDSSGFFRCNRPSSIVTRTATSSSV